MQFHDPIYIAGHNGLVGSALVRALTATGYKNLIRRTVHELDLRNQQAVFNFFSQEQPAYVFLAAAKVGGIGANNRYRAEFIYDNLMIAANVIEAAYRSQVKKLLFLGSSCIYPRLCPQPIKEEYLLTGALEPTNQPYALAKIAGIELCQAYNFQYGTNFISAMPTNLYGPGDTFDPENAHVIPALITKLAAAQRSNAPSCTIWGTGKPRREFLFVDDLAEALIMLMYQYNESPPINVGVGQDISIAELACTITQLLDYQGTLMFDTTKPDGTPQKLLDSEKIRRLGWQAQTSLSQGLEKTIAWYKKHYQMPDAHHKLEAPTPPM